MDHKDHTYSQTKDYYNKVSSWRSGGFLKGWTGAIAKRRVLPALKSLNLKNNDSWLDMGCGPGFNQSLINKSKLFLYGIDLAENNINLAKKNIPQGNFIIGNVENLPYLDDSFDKISYLHVIEHVHKPIKSLLELRRVLKMNGKAVISFQNKFGLETFGLNLSKKFEYILGGDKAGFSKPKGVKDVRRSYFQIKKMCKKTGLNIVRVDGCILMLPSIAWRFSILRKPTLILSDFLQKLPLIKYFSSYIAVTVTKI
jgi:ubiquinone/menaquinone biosynthesis C-methylase UbiE